MKIKSSVAMLPLGAAGILLLGTGCQTAEQYSMTYGVITQEGRGFTLYRPAESAAASDFDLPVYAETSGTATRVVLTPFAVAGDTAMVGVVAAFVGFLLWVQGGGAYSH
jgi:hypothetical protein